MNEDFADLLAALLAAEARFLVVGAHAMAVHGVPRATGDLDVWIATDAANVDRTWSALGRFGAPLAALGFTRDDFRRTDQVIQIGLPPRRIDVLTSISGVDFEHAWARRVEQQIGPLLVPFIGRADLIQNKRVTGRPKDLADLAALGEG